MKKIKKYIKRIMKLVKLDEIQILPGHLAFHLIFLIIPISSFINLLSSIYTNNISNIISKNIPIQALNIINNSINPSNIIIYIILSIWLTSRGCKAIITSSNILFKIKDKDKIRLQIKSFFMAIILFVLINFVFLVPTLGNIIIDLINPKLGNYLIILNYPISITLMFILIKSLYYMAPNKKIKNMNKGTIFTTISWLLLSKIYSYYLNNYTNYNMYYGELSNILILFLWIYLLAYIFTIGMVLNADDYFVSKLEIK